MRIKKIEVNGFKSFADREVIHVDDHVTAILGPNGCGKSNVVDAMRWCLGEQRAKHLRGQGMADVIFAGCSTRGPGNAAEVTLTFQNNGQVPAAYLNFAEIAVTRRLFRDGTSEYLINKVPCRLRDIQELMAGTGAGTRGYSIIEQGQVGRIVSSKAEERRYIIDEAAGITRFKAQKQAAEKKIEQTQQNLLRVSDVLSELEARVGNLRRQAQKAERYKRYRSELRDLDLWIASHRFLELEATRRVLEKRRGELGEQVDDMRATLAAADARGEAQRTELLQREQELRAAQTTVFDLDNRIKLAESEGQFRRREQEGARQAITQARAEAAAAERSLTALRGELEQVTAQLAELREGANEGHDEAAARLQEEHDGLAARLRGEVSEFERGRQSLARLHQREATAAAQLQARAEGLSDLEQRISGLSQETELLGIQLERDRADLEVAEAAREAALERVAALGDRRAAHDREKQALKGQIKSAEQAHDAARGQLQRVQSRVQSLEEIQKRYRGCASGVQVVIQNRDALGAEAGGAILGILADHLAAPAKLEAALSAVLGDRLQGVVVDGVRASAAAVALLKAKQEGRTSFLPRECRPRLAGAQGMSDGAGSFGPGLEDMLERPGVVGRLVDAIDVPAELRPLARALLGDTVVVEDLPQALELWQAGATAPLVTLAGDRVEPTGVVIGGSAQGLDSALLQQKREIRELHEQVTAREAEVVVAFEVHQQVVERQSQLEAEREMSEMELLESERVKLARVQEVSRLQREIQQLAQRSEQLTKERNKLQASLGGREEERARLTEELAQVREELPGLQQTIVDAEARIEMLREQQAQVAEMLTEAKVALARFQQQLGALTAAEARLSRQVAAEDERLQRLGQAQVEGEAKIAALEEALQAAEAEREQQLEAHRTATTTLQAAREAHDAVRTATDELDLSVRKLRNGLDEQRERLAEVESALKEQRMEAQHLAADIRERFDAELELSLCDYHDRPLAGPDSAARQQELKRVLARMGEVNLTAIEEFEEVSSRCEYLSTQKRDLESAISQLQEAIDKINKTTRERFLETFREINERFQLVFPRLFNGGQALLKLTDPGDLLGTGVEIQAQPPGKQVRNLELLSGGEKALTAVSLIFAIFLIKPSPFCLLDEVDAPLDEANVGRFGAMVQEMAQNTQFIIITHNKRTMEIADRLYGVTMETRGVSKLVSVNIKRAVEMAVA
ncbi:chromosome segregation protein SMC [Nannocystis sp. SCPEA4]|uniref:chromosome segregation protein SMC n=1 Tax=Nannocystis sp. SCPEA4 TaxID=2996787 RepID=UPI0022710F2D|nr:chromosome segregation protein SMC [Nannocystis sp. SCPEA4]MCY1057791.1 chromosome segregation protein SMC [Nannocystis sp. SCPEA4]